MKYVFIAGLTDFRVEGVLENPVEVTDGILLSNNVEHIKNYIQGSQMVAIGSLELDYLLSGNPVVFKQNQVDSQELVFTETVDFMRGCLAFLTLLWIENDNSINFEQAFAVSQSNSHVHSNSLSHHFWSNQGDKGLLTLGKDELIEIVESKRSYLGGLKSANQPDDTFQRKETGRINIGNTFLLQARSTPDLGLKIANYCSYFEAMLSSNTTELSHQMAERAAFYLRDDPQERLDHYQKSKLAYGIRSAIVHGDSVSKRQLKDIKETAKHCDAVARELTNKMMTDEEYYSVLTLSDSQHLDAFMKNKIFGIATN